MRRFIFIFLCICTVQAAPQKTNRAANATPPLTIAERNKILNEFRDFLKKPVCTLKDLNLFVYKTEEDTTPEVKPVEVKAPQPVEIPREDLLVLQAVGKAIKPDGSLSTQGQYVLCISGHRILKPGDTLYAKFRGNDYPIILKSVTRNQFTLEINKKELTFQY